MVQIKAIKHCRFLSLRKRYINVHRLSAGVKGNINLEIYPTVYSKGMWWAVFSDSVNSDLESSELTELASDLIDLALKLDRVTGLVLNRLGQCMTWPVWYQTGQLVQVCTVSAESMWDWTAQMWHLNSFKKIWRKILNPKTLNLLHCWVNLLCRIAKNHSTV